MFGHDDESCNRADDWRDNMKNDESDERRKVEITPGVNHRFRVVKNGKVMWRTNSEADALRVKKALERSNYWHSEGEVYNATISGPMTDDEIKQVAAAHEYCGEEEALNELWIAAQERELYRSATPQ